MKLHNPLVEVLICGALAVLCSTEPVAQDPYPLFLGLSDAAEHACGARHVLVMYRSPILVETLFAPPTARRTPQGVEHSDQILGTRLTRSVSLGLNSVFPTVRVGVTFVSPLG